MVWYILGDAGLTSSTVHMTMDCCTTRPQKDTNKRLCSPGPCLGRTWGWDSEVQVSLVSRFSSLVGPVWRAIIYQSTQLPVSRCSSICDVYEPRARDESFIKDM